MKSSLIIFVLSLLSQCQEAGISYERLKSLENTHSISQPIQNELVKVLSDTLNFGKFEEEVILIIFTRIDSRYEVCISKTNFTIFKGNRPDNFSPLQGYFAINTTPILIFGDIPNEFVIRRAVEVQDILGPMPMYDLNNPPIIYEPRMICHWLQRIPS